MDNICFDYQSLYAFPSYQIDYSSLADRIGMVYHNFISNNRNTVFKKNIVTESDASSLSTVMYQDKTLGEKMRSISEDVANNKLCLVTLKDTYENICDFLFNDSIILLAHSKLQEDVGEFKYYKTARSTTNSVSTRYVHDLFVEPFYISLPSVRSNGFDFSASLTKEIDKKIILEMLGVSEKMRKEYKLHGVFYYTTVLFYANKSLKTFCDTGMEYKDDYCLTCQEVLDLINKKEEN